MRQFFISFLIFTCSSVLADHDRTGGHNHNGRTFECEGHNAFNETRAFAEKYGGKNWYNFALCQLHRGPEFLFQGISTLQGIADQDPLAAVEVARYYSSGGYDLPMGTVTENESNLLNAIAYEEKALKIMSSPQFNYPFNDPHGDDLRIEQEDHPYLNTASNLTGHYMSLYSARSLTHIRQNIKNDTLTPLNKVIEAANRCLAIPYDSRLWNRRVYNNTMYLCKEDKQTAKGILPLESMRLQAAHSHCQGQRLSNCEAHNTIDRQIEQIYTEYLEKTAKLLSAL